MLAGSLVWQGELAEAERWLAEGGGCAPVRGRAGDRNAVPAGPGSLEIARGHLQAALATLRAAERLPGQLLSAAHPLTTQVRGFLLHVLVQPGETAQADAALTETAEQERERPGIRTAVAALRLAQDDPRAATAALAPVLDSPALGAHQVWQIAALLLEASSRDALSERKAAGHALERALDLAGPDGPL